MSTRATAVVPLDRKTQIMEWLRAGETPLQIREKLIAAEKEEFQKRMEEVLRRSQQYTQPLQCLSSFRQEAREFDFLAAGRAQVSALKDRVQVLQGSIENAQGILNGLNQQYDRSSALNASLSGELQRLQRQLQDAPPVIPFHGTLLEAGDRLCRPEESMQRTERRARISRQQPGTDS
jgi:chromosome segregation ATPase